MALVAAKHDVFQAIADPTRRQLLRMLTAGEEPIVAISSQFPISRTAVNKHLAVLQDAGLVSSRKVGRETRYSIQPTPLVEVKEWLAYYEQFWGSKLAALTRLVEDGDRLKQ